MAKQLNPQNVRGSIQQQNDCKIRHDSGVSVHDYLRSFFPMPPDSIFIGKVISDNMPLMLNIAKNPQAVFVIADAHSGKTDLLKQIYRGIEALWPDEQILPVVLTDNPSEWRMHNFNKNIYDYNAELALACIVLYKVATSQNSRRRTVFLVDNLPALHAAISAGDTAELSLRMLLAGQCHKASIFSTIQADNPAVYGLLPPLAQNQVISFLGHCSDTEYTTAWMRAYFGVNSLNFDFGLEPRTFATKEGTNPGKIVKFGLLEV